MVQWWAGQVGADLPEPRRGMAPAGLSILTTSFNSGDDRNRALGVWGAISGLAAAAGVFLGGVLSQGPGWR
jgi:MFS family permease